MSIKISRKVRYAVIGALVAGATALALTSVPSGATLNATQRGDVDVQTADLNLNLSDPYGHSGTFVLSYPNLAPNTNDTTNNNAQTQTFYVKNTGTIAGNASVGLPISDVVAGSGLTASDYGKLLVSVNGSPMTPVTSMPSSVDLGRVNAGQTIGVNVKMALKSTAGNEWKNQHLHAKVTATLDQA